MSLYAINTSYILLHIIIYVSSIKTIRIIYKFDESSRVLHSVKSKNRDMRLIFFGILSILGIVTANLAEDSPTVDLSAQLRGELEQICFAGKILVAAG